MVLASVHNQNKIKKIPHTITETFSNKHSIQKSTRFHDGFFELANQELFMTEEEDRRKTLKKKKEQ